jgi:SSS family solute:Na+ symporter
MGDSAEVFALEPRAFWKSDAKLAAVHWIDWLVVGAYFVALLIAGVLLARRAAASSENYFLGGHRLPWWALGSSGMASNLDVAGTMTIVTLIVLYGLHGFWIEMRGGVVLPIAVFVAFMGKWHRRSRVMTTAEWMRLRFGDGAGGRAARTTAALTYLILTIAMVVFFFSAGGSFLAEFVGLSATECSLLIALVTFGYTLVGGLYAVIWTDVFQAFLIGAAALFVSITAAGLVSPELLASWPGARLNTLLPRLSDSALEPYAPFWIFLAVWMLKGVLEGLGGSGGSAYMAQRFYAAPHEDDCRKIGILWTLLFAVRWPMVLGFAIIAMKLGIDVSSIEAAEQVLPQVLLSEYFPAGVRGLMLSAMLAAAMSTFDSTINAGASYVVRDLYEPLRPAATERERVRAGYVASALIVGLGLFLALSLKSTVLGIWVGIVMLLFPAFLAPFALRWFWARFNGPGFAIGIAGGFLTALCFWLVDPVGWNEATRFLAIAGVSAIASFIGTIATSPVQPDVLRNFYEQVRPLGFWPRAWSSPYRAEHHGDLWLLVVALAWQVLTFLVPMVMVLGMWRQSLPAILIWAVLTWVVARGPRRSGAS